MAPVRNVVLFGECGVGKTSICTILGKLPAGTLALKGVKQCTDESTSYLVTLGAGVEINLWDTICPNPTEETTGVVSPEQYLKRFLQFRMMKDGIDLLLYCVRGASGAKPLPVKRDHWENYKFVFEEVCKKKVPIAMIVTYPESYDPGRDMDTWWKRNEQRMLGFGFQLCAHTCITVEGDANQSEVSRSRLQDLLSRNLLAASGQCHIFRNVLLLGDREDRDDFVDMIIPSRNKQNTDHKAEGVSPFTCIPIALDGHTHANCWNMSAFDETNDDVLVTKKTLELLVRGIKQTPGIDLLLFCFRAGSPRIRHARNYKLFYAAICRKKVPTAVIVLGPDKEANTWWERNEQDLRQKGFVFDRHVYVPCNPRQLPNGDLNDATRHRLVDLVREEYTSGSWNIGGDPFWVTVPNVHAVIGELSWPTTTIVVCDATKQGVFSGMELGMQSSLQYTAMPQHEYRFQLVDPQNFLPVSVIQSSDNTQSYIADQGNRGISLTMFFVRTEKPDDETWGTLEKFYSTYKGAITPFIVVVCGAPESKAAEDFWKAAPRHIQRRVGAYLTYHPGPNASPEARAAAQKVMIEMIQHRCLVDLGEKVGILQEILSAWRKYRST